MNPTNAENRPTLLTFADNSTLRQEYNSLGQVAATVDALNRRTEFVYDSDGHRTRTTFADTTFEGVTYDLEKRPVMITNRAGRVTQNLYDALGRRVATLFADGSTNGMAYSVLDHERRGRDVCLGRAEPAGGGE